MKDLKINVILGLVILSLVIGFIGLVKTPSKNSVVSFGNVSTDGSQSVLPNPSNFDYLVARLALGFGTNVIGSNVVQEAQKQVLATATTTICTIQNPFNATSTILSAGFNITTGTSTPANGINFIMGTTTGQYSTTTNMLSSIYTSPNTGTTVVATWDPGVNNSVLGPKEWITMGALASSSLSALWTNGINVTGTCQAVFQSVN